MYPIIILSPSLYPYLYIHTYILTCTHSTFVILHSTVMTKTPIFIWKALWLECKLVILCVAILDLYTTPSFEYIMTLRIVYTYAWMILDTRQIPQTSSPFFPSWHKPSHLWTWQTILYPAMQAKGKPVRVHNPERSHQSPTDVFISCISFTTHMYTSSPSLSLSHTHTHTHMHMHINSQIGNEPQCSAGYA